MSPPRSIRAARRPPLLLLPAAVLLLHGCTAPPPSAPSAAADIRPLGNAPAPELPPVATPIDARPAALVNGRSVSWGELRPILNEAAGATALQEVILDRLLAVRLQDAGIVLGADDVAAERRRLLDTLSNDPNHALRLLDELRSRQGLGRHRFEGLMRRNAALRGLVRDEVQVTEAALRTMHEVMHGPKRQARLIVVPSLPQARAVRGRVAGGESFGDVAVALSTDSSAERGGLLEPIARRDGRYPESVRKAIFALAVGAVSDPILVENGYAVVRLERILPAGGTSYEEALPDLERTVRLNQERLLMDDLARRMLAEVSVSIFDDELHESWTRSRAGVRP